MKSKPTLLLLTLPLAANLAAQSPAPRPSAPPTTASKKVTPGSILAAQIREIAATRDLTPASKRRQIAAAVRLAVTTTLTNVKDVGQAFQILEELATASAQALPDFADVISESVSDAAAKVPVLASRADLVERIQESIAKAADAAGAGSDAAGAAAPGGHEGKESEHEFGGHNDDVIVSPSK